MTEQPLALVFTDIVGSTRLLLEIGPHAYATELAQHQEVVRAAAARHDGREVNTQGDSFFLVFPDVPQAARAAREITADLARTQVQVRVGLHVGAVLDFGTDYVGPDVHVGARIAATAHGGQVVASEPAAALVPPDLPVVPLGEHRLKDLPEPLALFQLGTDSFPPLRSLGTGNLPAAAGPLIGRADDLDAVLDAVADGARLVCLTGPGGMGKTHVALAAAHRLQPEFPAGAWWVDLVSVRDARLFLPSVALAMSTSEDVAAYIADRRLLLVLDTLEQLPEALPQVQALLRSCARLVVVATSRGRLGLPGEREWPLSALPVDAAEELFVQRSGLPPGPAVRELCARLDGLPLAVELAASRARSFGTEAVLDRLGRRLDLLTGARGTDHRVESLRETIRWSDSLLSDEERATFRRLSLFPGGWTLDSAERVVSLDLDHLEALLRVGLVRRDGDRFLMLETIRDYAAEGLADDPDRAALEDAFWRWAVHLLVTQDRMVRGPQQQHALAVLDAEIDNLRAAWELMVAAREPDAARRAAHAARWWLYRRGLQDLLLAWVETALEQPGNDEALLGWILLDRSELGFGPLMSTDSRVRIEAVVDLGRHSGDRVLEATALEFLGYISPGQIGLDLLEQARETFRSLALTDAEARATINIGARALNDGDDERARVESARAVAMVTGLGNQHGLGVALTNEAAAVVLGSGGGSQPVAGLVQQAADAFDAVGDRLGYTMVAEVAAVIAARSGDADAAAALLGAADLDYDRHGEQPEPSSLRLRAAAGVVPVPQPPAWGSREAVRAWLAEHGLAAS